MKKSQIWLMLIFSAILLPRTEGGLITQYEPVIGTVTLGLAIELTNNDEGAIYDSGTLWLLTGLAQQLWDIVPDNQSNYADIGEMLSVWNINIESSSQVYNGWNRDVNADGSIELSHIGGIPDFTYTVWRDSINYPNQNTMALTIQIPLSQLELDGEPGYNPLTDARIEIGSTELPSAFVANTGSPATGLSYEVIPEPSSVLLSVFGLLLFGWYHRLLRKSASGGRDF